MLGAGLHGAQCHDSRSLVGTRPRSLGRRRQAPALPAPSQADNGEGAAAHVAAPAASGGAMHAPAAAGTAGAATEEDVAMVLLPSEGIVKYR